MSGDPLAASRDPMPHADVVPRRRRAVPGDHGGSGGLPAEADPRHRHRRRGAPRRPRRITARSAGYEARARPVAHTPRGRRPTGSSHRPGTPDPGSDCRRADQPSDRRAGSPRGEDGEELRVEPAREARHGTTHPGCGLRSRAADRTLDLTGAGQKGPTTDISWPARRGKRYAMQGDVPGTLAQDGPIVRESSRPLSDAGLSDEMAWSLLDAAPDGIIMADEDGLILLVNRQTEDLFGYERGDLLGRSVDDLLPERFRQIHRAHRTRYRVEPRTRTMGAGLTLFG